MMFSLKEFEEYLKEAKTREEQEAFLELIQLIDPTKTEKEEFLELFKLYAKSKKKDLIELEIATNNETKIVSRISEWRIVYKGKNKYIIATLENGLNVVIPFTLFRKDDAETIYRKLKGLMYGTITANESGVYGIYKAKFYDLLPDYETAKKLLEKEHPIKLFIEGIGLKFNFITFRTTLPRLLTIFKVAVDPYHTSAIHMIQFTITSTGKTAFYLRLKNVFNIGVFTSAPSPARLIYDAGKGRYGEVFLRDIIVVDAFDKVLEQKDKAIEFLRTIETGLSQGYWTREVSGAKGNIQDRKDVAFVFLGNLEGKLLGEVLSAKEYIKRLIKEKLESEGIAEMLMDRIHIFDLIDSEEFKIVPHISDKFLHGRILKALKEIIESKARKVIEFPEFPYKGKDLIRARQLYKVLIALNIEEELAKEITIDLLEGNYLDLEKHLKEVYQKITGQEPEVKIEREEKVKPIQSLYELYNPFGQ